jgi:hypothetical protein
MKKLFEISEEGLGGSSFFKNISHENFGRSLWRFWRAMKEKLWE